MRTLTGLPTARGFAIGPVFIYRGEGEIPVPEYVVEPGREDEERLRLRHARIEAQRDLDGLAAALGERGGSSEAQIFESHRMMLEDPLFVEETLRYIAEGRLNAEAAVKKTAARARARFGRMNDPYLRERVRDIEDVERRLLKILVGFSPDTRFGLKTPSIVVADDLTPSETVQLPRDLVLGFATNGGSTTSHVALLARAMGIPAVTGLVDVTATVRAGETILLDGTSGTVTVSPDRETILRFHDLVERQRELSEEASAVAGRRRPAGTLRGGGEVPLFANVHPGVPFDDIRALGARGIGLYRSEYLWLNAEREPSEDEQAAAYREAADFAASLSPSATVTIRALDIGGDKMLSVLSRQQDAARRREPNPFLGNRSIRYLLSNRHVFRTQLRAVLRASAAGNVRLMYPMVSCVEELRAAAEVLAEVRGELDREGVAYDPGMKVGTMIEVPAAAVNADAIARFADFFSIGTNDLVQYTMAADRGNDAVASLYQPTNPAVLKLMRGTIAAAKRRGIPVGVCGESAADPLAGVLWAAMGVNHLSMSATYIPVISKLLSRLTRDDLDDYLRTVDEMGDGATGGEIMDGCRKWMLAHIPDLDNIAI
ncbi:MAG: phosphoenolpyruvate--protein phosphotransferase [Kiritimatiellae bacterium]|nr:phosphoenolpyruvate--protein phosphotransferase [Kiritimatiellia bacterium]